MSPAPFYVLGNAASATPWVLSLDGYPTLAAAEQAIRWQRVGQGQFDPPDFWQIVELADLREMVPNLSRSPYTSEAFHAFLDCIFPEVSKG